MTVSLNAFTAVGLCCQRRLAHLQLGRGRRGSRLILGERRHRGDRARAQHQRRGERGLRNLFHRDKLSRGWNQPLRHAGRLTLGLVAVQDEGSIGHIRAEPELNGTAPSLALARGRRARVTSGAGRSRVGTRSSHHRKQRKLTDETILADPPTYPDLDRRRDEVELSRLCDERDRRARAARRARRVEAGSPPHPLFGV